MAHTILN
ncbi:unnamed protein product [Linum tenue]|nr:unnamed protein product [Linum tenue]CAI0382392.1 unnamed protein product [Linum tenue]CAI0399078.1 unnamed protein product [Linum tenue]CAI0407781.1 unnamed protein product [Linum tenue]CAI0435038.1 unnamed protein product [Linum tenue]